MLIVQNLDVYSLQICGIDFDFQYHSYFSYLLNGLVNVLIKFLKREAVVHVDQADNHVADEKEFDKDGVLVLEEVLGFLDESI